jgi:hypothetical protein
MELTSSDWAHIMGSLCNVLTATNSSLNMWIYLNKASLSLSFSLEFKLGILSGTGIFN